MFRQMPIVHSARGLSLSSFVSFCFLLHLFLKRKKGKLRAGGGGHMFSICLSLDKYYIVWFQHPSCCVCLCSFVFLARVWFLSIVCILLIREWLCAHCIHTLRSGCLFSRCFFFNPQNRCLFLSVHEPPQNTSCNDVPWIFPSLPWKQTTSVDLLKCHLKCVMDDVQWHAWMW